MRYRVALSVPAGTTKDNYVSKTLLLVAGRITEIEIYFPAGQSGLVHVAIFRQEHQLWPTSPNESFIGDDTHIIIHEDYLISNEPYSLEVRGWAPNASLDHTVYVDMSIEALKMERVTTARYVRLPEGAL